MEGYVEFSHAIAALIGLFVGSVATIAFFVSEYLFKRSEPTEAEPLGVDPELMSVLSTFDALAIILDDKNRVLRADAGSYVLGIVEKGHVSDPRINVMAERVRRTGVTYEKQVIIERDVPNNSSMHFLFTIVALRGGRVLVMAKDLAKERRLEKVQTDFTANVSHELKTPISAIQLLSETIVENADDPEAVHMFAPRLLQESHRLSALVQDIMALSRVQQTDALVDAEPISIDQIVIDALESEKLVAERNSIHLSADLSSNALVWGQEDLLLVAVRNLIDNAINYSPPDRSVAVRTDREGEFVTVSVKDHGVGLSEKHQSRIFERFYRVDKARSRNTGGTGLGLSIVKQVVENHGGHISVSSTLGKGSTFVLSLPEFIDAPGGSR